MEKKLKRNQQEKMIAGVCAGLADYFDVDVTWVRIVFVLAVFAGMSGVLAYIILWIAVPSATYRDNYGQYTADYKVSGATTEQPHVDEHYPRSRRRSRGGGRIVAGLLFIIFGTFFLLDEFNFIPYWFDLSKLWPLVFIIPGISMILSANRKSCKDRPREKQADWRSEENNGKVPPTNNEENIGDTDQEDKI